MGRRLRLSAAYQAALGETRGIQRWFTQIHAHRERERALVTGMLGTTGLPAPRVSGAIRTSSAGSSVGYVRLHVGVSQEW